jgi:hypothetical protein
MRVENPFVFGEIVDQDRFIDREREVEQLVRDLSDGQKIFLLSPRRFGKSSLVSVVFLKLKKQHIRTAIVQVSSYASYAQFLEKFAERVLRAAGPWDQTKNLVTRFLRRVRPQASYNVLTGEISLILGGEGGFDPVPVAPDIFALPRELAKNGGFRMAICLDEFQQILAFDGASVENALRNEVQRQREVAYVFSGSQPSLMEDMLAPSRPFHKAGPRLFLDKIPAKAWRDFIVAQFRLRNRTLSQEAVDHLLGAADLIPYDVQRVAHELWDYAELESKTRLEVKDVDLVMDQLVVGQSIYYERLWEQFSSRQRAVLQALAGRGPDELLSQTVRHAYRLGPASSVQKALQSLDSQDILDRYEKKYFFLDPIFRFWIQKSAA